MLKVDERRAYTRKEDQEEEDGGGEARWKMREYKEDGRGQKVKEQRRQGKKRLRI